MAILALTLDLDDTLWPVLPALELADQAVDSWLQQHHPDVARAWPIAAMRQLRARVAAERLDLDRVRLSMFMAARSGLWGVRMQLPDGLAIRQTEAARKLEKWAKAEGLRLEWQSRTADMPDGRRVEVQEPEFSWEPTPK